MCISSGLTRKKGGLYVEFALAYYLGSENQLNRDVSARYDATFLYLLVNISSMEIYPSSCGL